jgi:aminopeptidase N
MSSRLPCVLALLGFVPALPAQSNAERVLNGWYTPSHDFDLLHQRIEVRNFDWDSTSFDGRVVTTLASLRPGLDAIRLDMDRQLEVKSVTTPSGAALRFERPGDTLAVHSCSHPAAFGDTVRFTVDYHGRIEQGRGLYFFKEEPGRAHRPQQVYSGGGTDGNPRWIPTWGGPNDKETWELLATVPARLTVVSTGVWSATDRRPAACTRFSGPRNSLPRLT